MVFFTRLISNGTGDNHTKEQERQRAGESESCDGEREVKKMWEVSH